MRHTMPLLRLLVVLVLVALPGTGWAETVLRRGNLQEPGTLDVHKATAVADYYIVLELFEGLLTPSAAGKPVPGVAESWTVSEDGLVYAFALRPNAKWSNGTPVTAHDFVFAWRRAVTQATASPFISLLWPVANAEAISKGQEKDVTKLGIEAVNDRTVRITLRRPMPQFPSLLVHHITYPLPQAVLAQKGADFVKAGNLVGNGPFILAEHMPHSHLRLVRNPHYHSADQVKIDSVVYIPVEDQATELRRYRAGKLDITADVPGPLIPWIRENLGDQLHITPMLDVYYYSFNMAHEPWRSNAKLRRALSLAIDRDILVDKILQGGEIPAYSLVPPGAADYEPQTPGHARLTQGERDDLARHLLAESGYGPGKPLELELLFNTNDNHKRLAVAIAAMWREKLGLDVVVTNDEWKVFLEARNNHTFKDLARDRLGASYNDPLFFLESFGSNQPANSPGFSNPDYDRLLAEAGAKRDIGQRMKLLQEAERRLLDDTPLIPLFYYSSHHLVAPHVKGWEDNVMNLHPSRYLRIEAP